MDKLVKWVGQNFKGDPKKVYDEIQTLGKSYTPNDILTYAREHEESELHKCFDWNDTTAAEKWRLHTARIICCSLKATVVRSEEEALTIRLIQHDDEEKAYKPVTFTVRNEDEYGRLLKQAKAELAAFKKRYKSIVELASVIDEIDRIINS